MDKQQESTDLKRTKTSITWGVELHADVLKLAELDNRSLSNYVETQMTIIRDKAVADGVLRKK